MKEVDVLGDDLFVFICKSSLRIWETSKSHELAHGELSNEVVFLTQDRDNLRQVLGLGRRDIDVRNLNLARVHAEQTTNHGQQRGFTGTIRTNKCGKSTLLTMIGDRKSTRLNSSHVAI